MEPSMEPAPMYDEKKVPTDIQISTSDSDHNVGTVEDIQTLKRSLSWRQMQLMIVGGSIGTALFVTIGAGLISAGPGSLLLGFIVYSTFLAACSNCMAEMTVYMPVSGGWIRMASHWVDDSLGFALGWNFFLYEATLIPYEISALNLVISFWSDKVPAVAICLGCIVLYALINVFAVRKYGESEFWLSIGKLFLIALVFGFTFVTMVGGNPKHDAYGFRYWNTPGAFAEYLTTGTLGRFEGFLSGLWRAAFVIVGPEYCAMLAAEAKSPRKTLKKAFKTLYVRFAIFFIGGALAVGIVIPYNDPTLVAINSGTASGSGTGAASPYVIAMQNMGVEVLPHITNALLMTSIFSAGNSYVYCASRTLYALSVDGHAPKILRRVTRSGVPIYCFCVTMIFPFLSLLILGSNASQVVLWLANLTTASQIIDFIGMALVYLFFYRAMKAQNFSRDRLPYKGWFQPYCAWYGLITMFTVVCCYGYAIYLPGSFTVGNFFIYYLMLFVVVILYIGWKLIKKTKLIPALEVDLIWEAPQIEAYEATLVDEDHGLWDEVRKVLKFKKERHMA